MKARNDLAIVIYGVLALVLWCWVTARTILGPTAGFRRVQRGINPLDVVVPQPELNAPQKRHSGQTNGSGACWGYGERN